MKLKCWIRIGDLRTANLIQFGRKIKPKFAKAFRNDMLGPFQSREPAVGALHMIVSLCNICPVGTRVTRLSNKPQPNWSASNLGGL